MGRPSASFSIGYKQENTILIHFGEVNTICKIGKYIHTCGTILINEMNT